MQQLLNRKTSCFVSGQPHTQQRLLKYPRKEICGVFNCTKAQWICHHHGERRKTHLWWNVATQNHYWIPSNRQKTRGVFPNRLGWLMCTIPTGIGLVHCVRSRERQKILAGDRLQQRYCMTMLAPEKRWRCQFYKRFWRHFVYDIMGYHSAAIIWM